jgi:hypothetical protein
MRKEPPEFGPPTTRMHLLVWLGSPPPPFRSRASLVFPRGGGAAASQSKLGEMMRAPRPPLPLGKMMLLAVLPTALSAVVFPTRIYLYHK